MLSQNLDCEVITLEETMKTMRMIAAALTFCVASTLAQASGVYNSSNPGEILQGIFSRAGSQLNITSVITQDPNGSPWVKTYDGTNDLSSTPEILSIFESLTVVSNPQITFLDWTDWHEEILSPGWEWVPGSATVQTSGFVTVPGLSVVETSPTQLDFFFDPLGVNTRLFIRKQIQWTGTGDKVLQIAQYPTVVPIPAALPLFGSALAGLGLIGWRRRSS